jgi:hypothetical protein
LLASSYWISQQYCLVFLRGHMLDRRRENIKSKWNIKFKYLWTFHVSYATRDLFPNFCVESLHFKWGSVPAIVAFNCKNPFYFMHALTRTSSNGNCLRWLFTNSSSELGYHPSSEIKHTWSVFSIEHEYAQL